MGELPSKSVSTGGLGERETLPTPSSPVEGGRAGSEVIRTGELALPHICCSTWKSRLCMCSTVVLVLDVGVESEQP